MLANQFGRSVHCKNYLDVFRLSSTRMLATDSSPSEDSLKNAKPYSSIPKVPMLPGLGSTWAYFPMIGRYSTKELHKADILKNQKYGDIVRERFGPMEFVTCYTPEAMSVIMEHEGAFPVRSEFATLKAYREKRKEWYQPLGILTTKGDEWYSLRCKVEDYLMGDGFRSYIPSLSKVSDDFVTLMRKKRRDKMEVRDVTDHLYKWALECIFLVALDARLDCLNPDLDSDSDGMKMIEAMHVQLDCCNKMEDVAGNFPFWKFFPTPMWFKFTKAADAFTATAMKYIVGCIDRQLSNPEPMNSKTLLHRLLVTEKADLSTAMVIVADLIMGGIDTTSHTAAFLLYNLAKNPEKQERAYKEIAQILVTEDDDLTEDKCSELKYLSCCLKESMRLYPTVRGNLRIFDHDVVISGYRVPAGTAVLCALQVIHRNEQYFNNANSFIPERWQSNIDDAKLTYQPFGYGKRSCPGRQVAEQEILCLVSKLIRTYRIEYDKAHPEMDMSTRIVNAPDKPLKLQFFSRSWAEAYEATFGKI